MHKIFFVMAELDLEQLRAFAQVARRGSFSAAAEHMDLTQPAVSQRVRQLEKHLGVRLPERSGRGVTPTVAGGELLAHIGRIDGAVGEALADMRRFVTSGAERLRIGTGATACIYFLPPLLSSLRQRYPTMEMLVRTGNTGDMVKSVEENELDIALVTLPVSGRSLEVIPLFHDPYVVISSAFGPKLPARVTAQKLATLPVILYEPGGNTRLLADEWFRRHEVVIKPVMSMGSAEAIKELVAAGLCCAVVPKLAIPSRGRGASLIARPLSPKLSRELGLVIRRDKILHKGLREFIEGTQVLARERSEG
jgi:DNA-binding transcriptional LysR family regulator